MCGIYGWSWNRSRTPKFEKRYLLAAMLGHLNVDRGHDSWGWFATDTKETTKGVGSVTPKARHAGKHRQLFGHTRHATIGAKTVENTHPFVIGHITGSHNGVVNNHWAANEDRGVKYEVDSMHIFHGLNEGVGVDGLTGWGAIEWVDDRENPDNLFLCRLQGGSLAFARTNYGVVWSSDARHLTEALRLSGFKSEISEFKQNKIHYARNGEMYVSATAELHFGVNPFAYKIKDESKKREPSAEELRSRWMREYQDKIVKPKPFPSMVGATCTSPQSELEFLDAAAMDIGKRNEVWNKNFKQADDPIEEEIDLEDMEIDFGKKKGPFLQDAVMPCSVCMEVDDHAEWCKP